MRLDQLNIERAPGLPSGISTGKLSANLILLYGPNASGKSTLGRVMRGLLWPDLAPKNIQASARWQPRSDGSVVDAALYFGHVSWTESAPVALDQALASATHLRLQDLLETENSSDRDIAAQIQRELDGGYDLAQLTPIERTRSTPKRTLKSKRASKSSELRNKLDQTDGLAIAEGGLHSLEVQAAQAAGAPARLHDVDNALSRLDFFEEKTILQARLQALPEVSDGLAEDMQERLDEAQRDHDTLREEIVDRESARAGVVAEIGQVRFPGDPPSEEELRTWGELASDQREEARSIHDLEVDLEGARARLTSAREDIFANDPPTATPTRKDLETLATAIDDLASARADVERHPRPEGSAPSPLEPDKEERLHDARRLLADWITAPRHLVAAPSGAPSPVIAIALALVGVILTMVGIAVALLALGSVGAIIAALGTALVGLGVGLYLGPLLAPRPAAPPASAADALRARYEGGDYPKVGTWSTDDVVAVLENIREQLATAAQERIAADRHADQTKRANESEEKLAAARDALDQVAHALHLDPELPGLALSMQAARLHALGQARDEVATLEAKLETRRTTHRRAQASLQRDVSAVGLHEATEIADPTTLSMAIQALDRRLRALLSAKARLKQIEEELKRARGALKNAEERRDGLLKRCGLTVQTAHELSQRLVTWRERQGLVQELQTLQRKIDDLDVQDDLPTTREALLTLKNKLNKISESLGTLHGEIADIRQALKSATEGRTIEQAISELKEAEDDLAADRDLQLQAQAEDALIDWLRSERASTDAPELLRRARERFLAFTNNRYELMVESDKRFSARDHHRDRLQGLSELSDGTRIQLLLAVRLAWLESAEGDTRLPLFLDETLSITDAQRFEAIGGALLSLCSDGRQIFYATADGAEVRAWQQLCRARGVEAPQVVDLGEPTALPAWDPTPAPPTLRAEPPPIDGHDAVAWTQAAGLRRPNLQDDASSWPLSLVLFDALPDARRAFSRGVYTASQLDLTDRDIPLPLSDELLALARVRKRAIQATLEALRIGRGRPVTWNDVVRSNAITPRYQGEVRELVVELGTEPRTFMKQVRNIQNFRNNKADDLRSHLQDEGILDPRPTLSHEEVTTRAQASAREAIKEKVLTLADVEALVQFAESVVGVG